MLTQVLWVGIPSAVLLSMLAVFTIDDWLLARYRRDRPPVASEPFPADYVPTPGVPYFDLSEHPPTCGSIIRGWFAR